jgi:hypothetical protein
VREDHSSIVFVSDGLSRAPEGHEQPQHQRRCRAAAPDSRWQRQDQHTTSATDMHTAFCKSEAQRLRDTNNGQRF